MATITRPHKGMTYRRIEDGSACDVESVYRNPATGYEGRVVAPFAVVRFHEGTREFVPLASLENDEYFVVVIRCHAADSDLATGECILPYSHDGHHKDETGYTFLT